MKSEVNSPNIRFTKASSPQGHKSVSSISPGTQVFSGSPHPTHGQLNNSTLEGNFSLLEARSLPPSPLLGQCHWKMSSTVEHCPVSQIMDLSVKAEVVLAASVRLAKLTTCVQGSLPFMLAHLSTWCPLEILLLTFQGHRSNGISLYPESPPALFLLVIYDLAS